MGKRGAGQVVKAGFTLLELLIVMGIIAIFLTIAVPAFKGIVQEANLTKASQDLQVLSAAIESYRKDYGRYPAADGYMDELLSARFTILSRPVYDPFASAANTPYRYKMSSPFAQEAMYYIIYSVASAGGAGGYGTNGDANISEHGVITLLNDIICWSSNGYLH